MKPDTCPVCTPWLTEGLQQAWLKVEAVDALRALRPRLGLDPRPLVASLGTRDWCLWKVKDKSDLSAGEHQLAKTAPPSRIERTGVSSWTRGGCGEGVLLTARAQILRGVETS